MLGNRSWDEWIRQYSTSHQHPVNRICHTAGIPIIVVSIALVPFALWAGLSWWVPGGLFAFGWILQFVGHAFEGKPPEFFSDWRFLLVGVRWWLAKMAGKA
jgi:uncharacterized membrane protein YGL010W